MSSQINTRNKLFIRLYYECKAKDSANRSFCVNEAKDAADKLSDMHAMCMLASETDKGFCDGIKRLVNDINGDTIRIGGLK